MRPLKRWLTILIVMAIATVGIQARVSSLEEKVAGLYVAYFYRAPDAEGFDYWTARRHKAEAEGEDVFEVLKALSHGFSIHPSFTRAYGSMDNREFIGAIYRNVLGRLEDEQEVQWWSEVLNGGMSRSDFVATFVNAALTNVGLSALAGKEATTWFP